MSTQDKNLLVLSHTYNSFIKDPVEILAKEFKKVYVLVRYQPISELSKYIPLSYFKSRAKYSKQYSMDLTNLPKNVEVIPIPLWYLPFKFFYKFVGPQHAKVALKVLKERKIKFDLIHAHFAWSAGYAGVKIKEEYHKPLVITGHGYDVYEMPFRSEWWKKTMRSVFEKADKVLTVSESNKSCLESLGISNCRVISNGYTKALFFNKDKVKCRRLLNIPLNRKIVLTVGNLEQVKGHEQLVRAIKIVREKDPSIFCIHIGGGPLEGNIKEMIRSLNLNENMVLLGRRPHAELVDWFNACDVFVLPSLRESFGVVQVEAMACGTPVVATYNGGSEEVITSPDYGMLSEVGDVEALAENIYKSLHKRWEEAKILKYSEQYAWENITEKIVQEYQQVI